MNRHRNSEVPPARVWSTRRNPVAGFPTTSFATLVREHADLGERVRVRRDGHTYYDLVRNGGAFLVLSSMVDAEPIGTFDDVSAAILAGDRRVEAVRRGEFDAEDNGGWPRGAA